MQQQLLLLEDIGRLGRKGDIVTTKPGFARNFLLPQKKAVIATPHTLKLRAKLQEEREKQGILDKKESTRLADIINGKTVTVFVKVDPAGHMYGSVSAQDIVTLLENEGVTIDRNFIVLVHPIKETGEHKIDMRLKEGVLASFFLKVHPEGYKEPAPRVEVVAEEEQL